MALVAALGLLATGCGGDPDRPATGARDSTRATLVDPDGNGILDRGEGEPLTDRTDLAPRSRPTRTIATLAQLTDLHVRDEESPARVPFLDRYGEPFDPTFRPHEALSTQVAAAAIRAVDRERPDATLVTGDLTDNAQRNELAWATRLLDGGTVTPDSGARGYQGVQAADDPDPFYYRPAVDPPRHPGLLARAQRPVTSPGVGPWLGVPGNHDVLLQGELAADARTDAVARGGELVTSLDPRADLPDVDDASQAVDALLGAAAGGRSIRVAADDDRVHADAAAVVGATANGARTRSPDRADTVTDVRATGARPAGPGDPPPADPDDAGVRVIGLDTSSRVRGQAAETTPEQLTWLAAELDAAGARPVVLMLHQRPDDAILDVLDASGATVLAVVHGDSHRNRVTPHGRFWVIGTSSLADWPMQGRMLRIARTADGGYAIDTWMVDQDGGGGAGTARELAFLDAQGGRPQGYRGETARDRNARLHVAG